MDKLTTRDLWKVNNVPKTLQWYGKKQRLINTPTTEVNNVRTPSYGLSNSMEVQQPLKGQY